MQATINVPAVFHTFKTRSFTLMTFDRIDFRSILRIKTETACLHPGVYKTNWTQRSFNNKVVKLFHWRRGYLCQCSLRLTLYWIPNTRVTSYSLPSILHTPNIDRKMSNAVRSSHTLNKYFIILVRIVFVPCSFFFENGVICTSLTYYWTISI